MQNLLEEVQQELEEANRKIARIEKRCNDCKSLHDKGYTGERSGSYSLATDCLFIIEGR